LDNNIEAGRVIDTRGKTVMFIKYAMESRSDEDMKRFLRKRKAELGNAFKGPIPKGKRGNNR